MLCIKNLYKLNRIFNNNNVAKLILIKKYESFSTTNSLFADQTKRRHYFPIYRFPYVAVGGIINKLKKLNLYLFGLGMPLTYSGHLIGLYSSEIPLSFLVIGISTLTGFFIIGQYFHRMIGAIYVSDNIQDMRISYLDFWGKRKDVELPVEDILPLAHAPVYSTDFLYKKIYRYSKAEPFKLNARLGEYDNLKVFNETIGFGLGKKYNEH